MVTSGSRGQTVGPSVAPGLPDMAQQMRPSRDLPGAAQCTFANGSWRLLGTSHRMREVYQMVARIASARATVLIQGETGTGKELIARALHAASPRASRPLVTVDSGALAESLLESELFGYVKGAFTGAVADRPGFFEVAHGGTCFLDEIGEISPAMQVKLLRVLQEREVRRVGGTETFKVDVRVIAATNKDLAAMVAAGKFREDLFYRLSVVTIHLPPLRERRDDIPLLAQNFMARYAAENGKTVAAITPGAMALLVGYNWPGNVRELEHVIERAVMLTPNTVVRAEDLPPELRDGRRVAADGAGPAPSLNLRDAVITQVRRALHDARGNKKLAAVMLGINRRTLYRLAKRYEIPLAADE
jgi:transcriptional regulator with PAS, ATPase and Fis domain